MHKNISRKIQNDLIKKYKETVWVYLKKTNTKDSNYNPYLKVGETVTNKNSIPVDAVVRARTAEDSFKRELGEIKQGALECIVKQNDTNLFRICEKVMYNNIEYTPFKSGGKQCQIYPHYLGYSRIVLNRIGN